MPTATEQTLTVHDLYTLRDNIGLSRKECRQPPRTRSLFEWGKAQQAYYLDDLMRNITSPPVVYVWEPVDGSGKGAVLGMVANASRRSSPTSTATTRWKNWEKLSSKVGRGNPTSG